MVRRNKALVPYDVGSGLVPNRAEERSVLYEMAARMGSDTTNQDKARERYWLPLRQPHH
ncbi:MAG: hypothetical protein Rhims3KO_09590 [Hyphomicrobiales bacterium]